MSVRSTNALPSLAVVSFLAAVHALAPRIREFIKDWHGWVLSTAAGVSVAYVFMQLLPELHESQAQVAHAARGLVPFVERNAYVIAVLGLVGFYAIPKAASRGRPWFWANIGSFALLNMSIAYVVTDPFNPETHPYVLYAVAMGLHFLIVDHNLFEAHKADYTRVGRWVLLAALAAGWGAGMLYDITPAAIGIVVAFMSGGVIMNTLSREIPDSADRNVPAFAIAAIAYSLLLIGLA